MVDSFFAASGTDAHFPRTFGLLEGRVCESNLRANETPGARMRTNPIRDADS